MRASRLLWLAIGVAAVTRLVMLGAFPLMDPTETRYAEIARRMSLTGDWVTPWIAPGEPFWGKPPLSFWMTAGSFEAFGVGEFAARLPHWAGGVLLAWLAWNWLARRSRREAALSVGLLAGSVLFFVCAGAVMTDMALAVGLMLVMRGFWLALHGTRQERRREQALMFLGLAIGLLAKGPIALMAGAPIAAWALKTGQCTRVLREIRWLTGTLAVLAVVLPWYLLAELRTPGFLEYFLVGEHWLRYVDSGWQGDLYGHAHAFPRGTIWLFGVVAFLPWSLVLPIAAWKWRARPEITAGERSFRAYLLFWALTPCVVFTLSGNIMWTYMLPGIPALAMLGATYLGTVPAKVAPEGLLAAGIAAMVATCIALVVTLDIGGLDERKSMKALVADYESLRMNDERLIFFRKLPHSGAFYSAGEAELAYTASDLEARLAEGPAYVALRSAYSDHVPDELQSRLEIVSDRGEYALYVGGHTGARDSRMAASRTEAESAPQ